MIKSIHEDKFLSIQYIKEKSLLVLDWNSSPKSKEEFKSALLTYLDYVISLKISTAIWTLTGFKIHVMDEAMAKWIDDSINGPSQRAGMNRLAFVIGKDLYPHLNSMIFFRKFRTTLIPYNFASLEKAIEYLFKDSVGVDSSDHIGISFTNDGIDKDGNVTITIKSKQREISNLINCMAEIVQFENNYKEILSSYMSLTNREVDVLRLYSQGMTWPELSEVLCISELTARTHWKNIKRKLNMKSQKEVMLVANHLRR